MRKIIANKVNDLVRITEKYSGDDHKTVKSIMIQLNQIKRKLDIKPIPLENQNVDKKYNEVIKHGIEILEADVTELLVKRITTVRQMQKALIIKEYEDYSKQGMTYKKIKLVLSDKYGWSVSAIEKVVYRDGRS